MPRIILSLAGAWLLIAPPMDSAAIALPLVRSDASAIDRSALRYAQNSRVPRQPSTTRKSVQAQGPEKVYLLRGFLNVFSLGMDDIAAKLQADGISALVMNHAEADVVASQIVTSYNSGDRGPIVLVGHSLGADAIVEVADALARYNIPVTLMVLFDGTEPHQIPANLVTAVNYTKHFMIVPAPGSSGVVSNVDFSSDANVDHLSIDTVPSLQAQTLDYILQAGAALPRKPVLR